MVASAALTLCTWAVSGLASPDQVSTLLGQLGDADLVLANDPTTARPTRVLLATRIATRAGNVRQLLASPGSYARAMPAFRRIEVVSRRTRGGATTDLEVAWELEVPLWNLRGKLWMRPRADGVDVELSEGDLSPGLFHLTVHPDKSEQDDRSILSVEGQANVREANVATRQLVRRSPLAETGMTVAAAYVMLKALARLAESGSSARPEAALRLPELTSLDGAQTGGAMAVCPPSAALLAAVRSRADGRLERIEVALPVAPSVAKTVNRGIAPETFTALPGWKAVTVVRDKPSVCTDPMAPCWSAKTDLPLFSLDGTWKPRLRPWRARMVAGERAGALMGIDVVPLRTGFSVVLSEHPRLDQAGYAPRKLIAAEPYLEHGLALALTILDAVSLVRALEGR